MHSSPSRGRAVSETSLGGEALSILMEWSAAGARPAHRKRAAAARTNCVIGASSRVGRKTSCRLRLSVLPLRRKRQNRVGSANRERADVGAAATMLLPAVRDAAAAVAVLRRDGRLHLHTLRQRRIVGRLV